MEDIRNIPCNPVKSRLIGLASSAPAIEGFKVFNGSGIDENTHPNLITKRDSSWRVSRLKSDKLSGEFAYTKSELQNPNEQRNNIQVLKTVSHQPLVDVESQLRLQLVETENKAIKQENISLKEELRKYSVKFEQTSQLELRINHLEQSKSVEYVTISGMHEIVEGFLWLGDRFAASDTAVLKKLGITYMLTLYGTHEHEYDVPLKVRCIPLEDDGSTDLGLVFKRCFEFIEMARSNGQKILVHCAAGINRSPSIVIAYLMKTNHWRYQQAYGFVQDKRWFIQPTLSYKMQLKKYEAIVFGEKVASEEIPQQSGSGFSLMSIFKFWFAPNGVARPVMF